MFLLCLFSEICAAGETAADEGPGCKPCAADKYKLEEGREACENCPVGSSTMGETGSDQYEDCLGALIISP